MKDPVPCDEIKPLDVAVNGDEIVMKIFDEPNGVLHSVFMNASAAYNLAQKLMELVNAIAKEKLQ